MEICSQHADCNKVAMNHGERLAALETRVNKVEEVQADMITQLEDAAEGLRALAGKIDNAVSAAKKENNEVLEEVHELKKQEEDNLTGSINAAFVHFKNHFALFCVYGAAGGFVWFMLTSLTGDWKIESNVLKIVHKFIGG